MNVWVADPHWGGLVIAYFFFGGIAAGSYFLATLIEWFAGDDDQPLARVAHWIAFPLVLLCGVLLIVDLYRPERFWHMLLRSDIAQKAIDAGFPISAEGWRWALQAPSFKYWSPMSVGSWGLTIFGICAFTSFISVAWPNRVPGRWFQSGSLRRLLQGVGCIAGFFVASYTGTLLSATNQPLWSNTTWLAALFLASGVSTSLASITLIARWKGIGSMAARQRLSGAEPLALGLELLVLVCFFVSLGENVATVLTSWRGSLLIVGVLTVGIILPMLLHARVAHRAAWGVPVAASLVLLGGFLLRYSIVTVPSELLDRERISSPQSGETSQPGVERSGTPGRRTMNFLRHNVARQNCVAPLGRRRTFLGLTRGSAALHPWLTCIAPLGRGNAPPNE